MQKALYVVGGAVVTGLIDYVLGIDFSRNPWIFQILHKVIYMAWGVILWKRFKEKD